ncbi:Hsp33 family molecular chaperone HslO [bacterium]|nr:Hsp33 family molecular chaperone HslO [bacterium]
MADGGESAVERYKRLRAERLSGPTSWVEPAPPIAQDGLWRGLTREGEMRLLVARTSTAVRAITARLGCSDDVARVVAELATATLLVRSTLNPEAQVQLSIQNPGSAGRLLADVFPGEGGLRVSVATPGAVAAVDGPLLRDGLMQIARSRPGRDPYVSSTEFLGSGIETSMMEYLLHSEQILSFLRIDVAVQDGVATGAAGFLVQAMPEGSRADLERLVRNLDAIDPLRGAMTAEDPDARAWAGRLLDGFRWDQVAREKVAFACRCSRERVLALLAGLPREDIEDMVRREDPAETTCEFCRAVYRVATPDLRGLLSPGH